MPMTTTHALLPVAATVAVAPRPVPWRLVILASIAAAFPDVDGLFKHIWNIPQDSIYAHRGAAHSLFIALLAGLVAAAAHKRLKVTPIAAAVVVAAAMASHGLLDMMTNSGQPVAYLWPLSSARFFADWRPIDSSPVHLAHLFSDALIRFQSDLRELIIPMFGIAVVIRAFGSTWRKTEGA